MDSETLGAAYRPMCNGIADCTLLGGVGELCSCVCVGAKVVGFRICGLWFGV